ncbi:MAG: hypothetical protein DMD75_18550 [Candidatus Rokuibacteriota bacterium]|nr:MAG: hypothetical protein DMD75_18550 [Candidatus Rokubacteria bacterium]
MDTRSLDRLGDEIAELSAHLDAATTRLLDLIREFDNRAGWNTGFRSCAAWLSWRVGLDIGAARERVRVAHALERLPRLAQALARGELSYAKVRALTRVATPETEERLLAVGRAGTADHVERIVRGWRRMDRKAEAAEDARRHRNRSLETYHGDDGMLVIRGRLAPEVGALLVHALTAAREALYQRARAQAGDAAPADVSAETPTMAQQQADALGLLAETALHHGIEPGPPGERYQVVVHVDAPVLAESDAPGESALEHGGRVSAETSRRLSVRREPCGDATRSRWACRGGRCAYPHDPARAPTRAGPPRPRLPLSGLRIAVRSGSSHQALGSWRPHKALARAAVSPAPSHRSRRGLSGRSAAGRGASVPSAGRKTFAAGAFEPRSAR